MPGGPRRRSPATPWEARIDRLELVQASETSRDLRKKAFDEVQRIVVEQEPIIYLVNPDYLCGHLAFAAWSATCGHAAAGLVEHRVAAA